MATIAYNQSSGPEKAHSITEFISSGLSQNVFYSYNDFSFIQNIDKTCYIIKNVLDDYIEDMKAYCLEIRFTDKERQTYMYNPKLLSYRLYKTTMLYWVILRINDMCNVHEFNLTKQKLLVIKPKDLFSILNKIYNSEKKAIKIYNSIHEKDTTSNN